MTPASFSTDPYMGKRYIKDVYNCFDFAREVWLGITGEDIKDRLEILRNAIPDRKALARDIRSFRKLLEPEDPCLVMLKSPRTRPHIGVYLRGKLLHLATPSFVQLGVMFERLDTVTWRFKKVAFYK